MTDTDAVLAANLEFYRAFTMRDIEAMDAVWALSCADRLPPSRMDRADRPRRRDVELEWHFIKPRRSARHLL